MRVGVQHAGEEGGYIQKPGRGKKKKKGPKSTLVEFVLEIYHKTEIARL